MSRIGAVVKVVDSHLCGLGSITGRSCSFLIVSLSKSLSLCFMYSDQHVKYRIFFDKQFAIGLPRQTIHTHSHTTCSKYRIDNCPVSSKILVVVIPCL